MSLYTNQIQILYPSTNMKITGIQYTGISYGLIEGRFEIGISNIEGTLRQVLFYEQESFKEMMSMKDEEGNYIYSDSASSLNNFSFRESTTFLNQEEVINALKDCPRNVFADTKCSGIIDEALWC